MHRLLRAPRALAGDQSISAWPLTHPLTCMIGAASLARPFARRGRKVADAVRRFFEAGPWGPTFDRLTWLPWVSTCGNPGCLFVDATGTVRAIPISDLPPSSRAKRRLVMISDTHGKHRLLRLPAGNVLIHTGDILSRNACVLRNNSKAHTKGLAALQDFNAWLGTTPHQARVVIAGNHDATLEQLGATGTQALLSNAVYLQDGGAMVEGLSVWGTPWSPLGKSANRAFQSLEPPAGPPTGSEPVDVLLSHCHVDELAAAVRPAIYVSGHAHESHGVKPAAASDSVEVNAAICDHLYRAVHVPIVMDIALSRPERVRKD